ncbi:hypothetical protein JFU47_13950 [Pseudomonas sp. TH39(2020)]|uniref:hypothetical protein n=1 Tax=Pseudomonas sp. TH39(2020) TaxID=2796349 RepID=UPI001913759B|nr:hypothetical protein [Pseudomonas sp. TH39(2020)]MBK5397794.1 hypothetical protein [Pseudomonas sp. TH39(2020)]
MDKAISWPLSQEKSKALQIKALKGVPCPMSIPNQAPLEGKAVDQAPVLLRVFGQKTSNLRQAMPDMGRRQP